MKKNSQPTPKQLLKKRVANNKLIKVVPDKCNFRKYGEKEIAPLSVEHSYKKKLYQRHERVLKEDTYRNPYALPERVRVTTKSLAPRKEKAVPFIMDEPYTICDIDPEFYAIVEGRPIRSFYDIKSYISHIRDVTLFRASAGYLKEQIIQIEAGNTFEEEEYVHINEHFEHIKDYFMSFAEDSFRQARHMQELAEEAAQRLAVVTDRLEGYSFEFAKLKNEYIITVTTYEKLSRYKKFLTYMAPQPWMERYESSCTLGTELCTALFAELGSENTETVTFYKKSTLSLAQLKPQLYFKKPSELVNILECSTRQCLNYMEIDTIFSKSLAKVNAHKQRFQEQMMDKCAEMQYVIELFTEKVKFMIEKRDEYRTIFEKLLEKQFYKLVASYESTKLFTCLQYVHTELYKDKADPKDGLTTLMLNIERFYNELSTKLDDLNLTVVKLATKQAFDEDNRIMQRAHDAQRQLKEYDVLCKALYKSFDPPKRKSRC